MKEIVIYDVVYNACVQSVRANINTPITAHHATVKKKCANTLMRIYNKHKSRFPVTKKNEICLFHDFCRWSWNSPEYGFCIFTEGSCRSFLP